MYTRIDPDDILQRIREKVAEGRNRKVSPTFRPPTAADFRIESQILAFDQTLSNCGWALLSTKGGALTVRDSGTIKPPTLNGQKGFEATLAKAVPLASRIQHVLNLNHGLFEEVVLELPAVVGYRTESSLIAAVMICVELDRMGCKQPEFVSRQAAGTILVGNRHATKAESSQFVNNLIIGHPTGPGCWTEHVRDACFVGMKFLYQEEK